MSRKWSKKVIERLQEKNAEKKEHKNVRAVLIELSKTDGYVIKPIKLIRVFYDWLSENHASKMNAQEARNTAEVFSVLCHIYFIAGEKYKIQNAFAVSQNVWAKFCIGRTALEHSINYLKEMNIVSFYNHCLDGQPERRKRMYIINRKMLEHWIETAAINAKNRQSDDEWDAELEFDNWGNVKSKKQQIKRLHIEYEEEDSESTNDIDDINDLYDKGYFFS